MARSCSFNCENYNKNAQQNAQFHELLLNQPNTSNLCIPRLPRLPLDPLDPPRPPLDLPLDLPLNIPLELVSILCNKKDLFSYIKLTKLLQGLL